MSDRDHYADWPLYKLGLQPLGALGVAAVIAVLGGYYADN